MGVPEELKQDLELVADVLRGCPGAQDIFVRRMRCVPPFLSVLNSRLGSPLSSHDLADLSQDTLIVIWKKLGTYSGRATLETWVHRFCQLELMNCVRRRGRHFPLSGTSLEAVAEGVAAREEVSVPDAEELERGLQELDPDEETVVRLKHFHDLMFVEIAEHLGISISLAKHRYYRGMTRLRRNLERRRVGELQ